MATSTYNPTWNSYLDNSATTTNRSAADPVQVQNRSVTIYRGVLAFDLSSVTGVITAASLALNITSAAAGAQTFIAAPLLIDNNPVSYPAMVKTEVCWDKRQTLYNWNAAGGDFDQTASNITEFAAPTATGAFTINVLPAIQYAMANCYTGQIGIILYEKSGQTNRNWQFTSVDNGTSANRPLLTLTTIPGTYLQKDSDMNTFRIARGSTSNIIHAFVQRSDSIAGLTALAYNTGSLVGYYMRPGDTATTALTLEDITTLGTWAVSGNNALGFKKVDDTNAPGLYEIHLPNNIVNTSAKFLQIELKGAANMAPCVISCSIEQPAAFNPNDFRKAGCGSLS